VLTTSRVFSICTTSHSMSLSVSWSSLALWTAAQWHSGRDAGYLAILVRTQFFLIESDVRTYELSIILRHSRPHQHERLRPGLMTQKTRLRRANRDHHGR
jgi:hypothetical protein